MQMRQDTAECVSRLGANCFQVALHSPSNSDRLIIAASITNGAEQDAPDMYKTRVTVMKDEPRRW